MLVTCSLYAYNIKLYLSAVFTIARLRWDAQLGEFALNFGAVDLRAVEIFERFFGVLRLLKAYVRLTVRHKNVRSIDEQINVLKRAIDAENLFEMILVDVAAQIFDEDATQRRRFRSRA